MSYKARCWQWAAGVVVCLTMSLTLWDSAQAQGSPMTQVDSAIQLAATRAMAGRSGAAVVIEVATGRVLATYHPEVAVRRLALPGSSIKTFTLLALLESGKINEQTILMCKRGLTVGAHNLDCTHPDMKQPFDPVTALAYSCNTYFATLAMRMTPAELRNGFTNFGFGTPSGLMPNEATGSVALAGTQAELQMQAIGEWGLQVTPLELLRGYQKLALLAHNHEAKLAPVFAGLEGSTAYGMGRLAQPDTAMKVAGKTGTSLVGEGTWRHGWFAGYAPADRPQIALVVFLEKGNGPIDASGVAREIFAAYAAARVTANGHGTGR